MALRWTGPGMMEAAKASGGSRPTSNCRSCGAPGPPIKPNTPAAPTLNRKLRPPSPINQRCRPCQFQHGTGHPPTDIEINFIAKPFSLNQLAAMVAKVMR
jgi:hypothetical protein